MNREASEVREISPGYGLETAKPVVPVGYKQTEVGVIPEDWDSVEVSQLLSEISMGPFGSDIKVSNFVSEGVPVLDGLNVRQERLLDEFSKFVTESKARSLKKAVARRGDVVITHRGTIGQVSYIPPDSAFDEYVISQSQFRARFNSDVLPQWVTVYFLSERGSKKLLEGKGHTGVPAIAQPTTTFRKLRLPVPPVAEQRAIAQALSDVDALLEELDRLIVKKRDIKQATMQQLLTGQTRLPGFEGEWEELRLGDIADFHKGKGLPKSALSPYGSNPCIHYGELFTKYAVVIDKTISRTSEFNEEFRSEANDVLMPTSDVTPSGLAKASCILLDDVLLGGDILVIRTDPEIVSGAFLSHMIRNDANQVLRLVTGTTVYHLYGGDMAKFEFRLPALAEQKAIVSILFDVEEEIQSLEKRRYKTAALKQAMMQELLTGRTRLVETTGRNLTEDEARPSERRANVYFMRSVLAAEIVDQLHEEPTFGHVKLEKVLYLVEHLCDVDTGSIYHRKAAGPYDNRALRSIDSQLRKQKWFDARKEGRRYFYEPLQKRGGHQTYFNRYFSSVRGIFDRIIETLRGMDTERCEIVATLYAAWNDLLRENGDVSDQAIVHEVLNNWHESKKRISEDRWLRALGWMRVKGITPKRD